MSGYKRFTNEQIEQANNINILDYSIKQGYDVKHVSGSAYEIRKQGGLTINSQQNKWYSHLNETGGGPIQFVMYMDNVKWPEAIRKLLGLSHNLNLQSVKKPDMEKEKQEKGPLILPDKNKTYNHMFAYLIKTRKIDKEVVWKAVKTGRLYENAQKSCVFIGYDLKGEAKYASYRSTNTKGKVFRGDIKNSDKSFPFYMGTKGDTVYVLESPIDVMSYISLYLIRNRKFEGHCISLGGVSTSALDRFLDKHKEVTSIMVCTDADQAGNNCCSKIISKYKDKYKIFRHMPKGKDFNEQLVMEKRNLEMELEDEVG